MKSNKLSSAHLIPLSFLGAILIGTILLMCPFASANGTATPFLTALFTSTTSVCVTGLVVVDTYSHWSILGQFVILILIQIGGLGIITILSLLMVITRKKFSLGDRIMLQDALNLNSRSGVLQFMFRIIRGTLIVEAAGAILYALIFVRQFGAAKGLWVSVFTAISAFCNAGLDIIGPVSLEAYQTNVPVLCITMILIILGGLGFVVWFDVSTGIRNGIEKKFTVRQIVQRFSEHTKLIISLTGGLILFGTLIILLGEYNNPGTIGNMSFGYKLLNSLFESVTLRTAGFSTFPQQALTDSSCIPAYVLMFIGGSPVGTAGGVKTITFFLVMMNVAAYVRGNDRRVVFRRTVSEELIRKAAAIVSVSILTVIVLVFLLIQSGGMPLIDGLFEVISACATVGLSRGLTAQLNTAGRWIIILAMYLGRIGPISMAIFFVRGRQSEKGNNTAEGNFYVG
ncbi:MAG: potassium uptake protein [Solobacterium sp.]|nr:potassium uptake protein [Solobacterium sp.]